MAVDTQVTTFSDLYTDLQNRVRAATGVTATENQAKRYINIALHDVALGFQYKLPWLERSAYLRTRATYTTGTISVTNGSTAVTGTSTAWATADAYAVNNARVTGKMIIAGGTDIYPITTVASDTSITLRDRYLGATNTAATYIYFEDEFALETDFLRPIDYQRFSNASTVTLIGRNEFRQRYPRPNVGGPPRVSTILDITFGANTTPVRRVQFYPYPDAAYLIPYSYITSNLAVTSAGVEAANLSADTDEPMMPLGYRHALVFHALYHWYRDKKDDVRSQEAKAEYTDIMLRITSAVEIGASNQGRIIPHSGYYVGPAKRPYSRKAGSHISVNDAFDRFE